MKIVKLKKSFIEKCIEVDSEFMTKTGRPYIVEVKVSGVMYIIPMTKSEGLYTFRLAENSFINFEKSFELRNSNIIDSSYRFPDKDMWLHREVTRQSEAIKKSFGKYLKKFPTKYSVNINKIVEIQNNI